MPHHDPHFLSLPTGMENSIPPTTPSQHPDVSALRVDIDSQMPADNNVPDEAEAKTPILVSAQDPRDLANSSIGSQEVHVAARAMLSGRDGRSQRHHPTQSTQFRESAERRVVYDLTGDLDSENEGSQRSSVSVVVTRDEASGATLRREVAWASRVEANAQLGVADFVRNEMAIRNRARREFVEATLVALLTDQACDLVSYFSKVIGRQFEQGSDPSETLGREIDAYIDRHLSADAISEELAFVRRKGVVPDSCFAMWLMSSSKFSSARIVLRFPAAAWRGDGATQASVRLIVPPHVVRFFIGSFHNAGGSSFFTFRRTASDVLGTLVHCQHREMANSIYEACAAYINEGVRSLEFLIAWDIDDDHVQPAAQPDPLTRTPTLSQRGRRRDHGAGAPAASERSGQQARDLSPRPRARPARSRSRQRNVERVQPQDPPSSGSMSRVPDPALLFNQTMAVFEGLLQQERAWDSMAFQGICMGLPEMWANVWQTLGARNR